MDQYRTKPKKKVVDPNAPPRPTLLGHEKEMKEWRSKFENYEAIIGSQELEISELRRKVNRLQASVDASLNALARLSRR